MEIARSNIVRSAAGRDKGKLFVVLATEGEYLLLADFESYRDAHQRAGLAYQDPKRWNQMALMNIARSGIFAADRSIRDYARDIWNVPVRALK